MLRVLSLFPLFSHFAVVQTPARFVAHLSGAISNGQPTRCGHRVLPGLASGLRPLRTLQRQKP